MAFAPASAPAPHLAPDLARACARARARAHARARARVCALPLSVQVRENELVAISQRDHTTFYPGLLAQKQEIEAEIVAFFADKLQGHFAGRSFCRPVAALLFAPPFSSTRAPSVWLAAGRWPAVLVLLRLHRVLKPCQHVGMGLLVPFGC